MNGVKGSMGNKGEKGVRGSPGLDVSALVSSNYESMSVIITVDRLHPFEITYDAKLKSYV